jgi:hypothetical protein
MKQLFLILLTIISFLIFSQDAEVLYNEGQEFYNNGENQESIAKFTEAIKSVLSPTSDST